MPTATELSDPYANFMLSPRPGPGVCHLCFDLTDGYDYCIRCDSGGSALRLLAPISYSVGGEQLHRAIAGYKRLHGDVARRLRAELAAVLWRFLARHEPCIAGAAGAGEFELVTTVPSSDIARDRNHPLRTIVGELAVPTRARYERLLVRSRQPTTPRTFDPERFEPVRPLRGEHVLLIDDIWTTGTSAQSAAAALRAAGAGAVAAVVIGRHLNRPWRGNDQRLRALQFDWDACTACTASVTDLAARSRI